MNNIKNEFMTFHTIQRLLIKNNLKAKRPIGVPFLLKRNVQKQLQFVEEGEYWPGEKWRNILWSDVTKCILFCPDCETQHVRRPQNTMFNSQCTIKTVKTRRRIY